MKTPFRKNLEKIVMAIILFLASFGAWHLLLVDHPKYCFDKFVSPVEGEW